MKLNSYIVDAILPWVWERKGRKTEKIKRDQGRWPREKCRRRETEGTEKIDVETEKHMMSCT